jgi:orotate phosphoribosyltransferase
MNMVLLQLLAEHAYHYDAQKPFILSSGAQSNEYLDCRTALGMPSVLHHAATKMLRMLQPGINSVGGLTMGADPLAVAISLLAADYMDMTVTWFSVRKEAKAHGRKRRVEGGARPGDAVAILEDVVTSGASTIRAIEACSEEGLTVQQVLVLVSRSAEGMSAIRKAVGPSVPVQALFDLDEIRKVAGLT